MVAIKANEMADPIAEVKRTVRIEDYAINKMGLTPKKQNARELWFSCPWHEDKTPSLHIRLAEQEFKCFSCGEGGDVIDLERRATGETNPRTAAQNILAEYGKRPEPVTFRPVRMAQPKAAPPSGALSEAATAWLAGRGISAAVARRNRVSGERNAITFEYVNEGAVINRQHRTLSAKGFRFDPGAPVIPFGLDDCDGQPDVVIVEGVMDKLSVEQATGRTAVLAMPSATPSKECYALACEALADATRIIVAVDNDEPGNKLRDELVRRLGTDRCELVDWGDVAKDANEVLMSGFGADGLRARIEKAVPFPVEGVFTVDDSWDAIERLYDEGLPPGASTGWPGLDQHYTVRRGQLTVITGVPGSGKSQWTDALLMNLAMAQWDWTFAICSPEMQPLERHWAHLIQLFSGKPFGKGPSQRLSREELRQAKEFVRDRFFMVLPEEPTVEAVLDRFLWTHRRHGVAGLLLDPWNELDHGRPSGMTETEYCNQALREMKRTIQTHDVWCGLIAHPTKLYRNKQDGTYPVPTLYDINGSAAFFNKADAGIVIHRDKNEPMKPVRVIVSKVRWQEPAGLGEVPMRYDKLTGRYYETVVIG